MHPLVCNQVSKAASEKYIEKNLPEIFEKINVQAVSNSMVMGMIAKVLNIPSPEQKLVVSQ